MKTEAFLSELAEVLEVEVSELDRDYKLDENDNWDSLALISVIVMVDEHFKVSLSNDALRNCNRVEDIVNLIHERMGKVEVH